MNSVETLSIDVFLSRLKELTEGLYFLSESDYPLEPIQVTVANPTEITHPELYNLAAKPTSDPIQIQDLPYFFRNMTAEQPEADEDMKVMAKRFRDLQAYLEQHLQHIKVYRIGQVEIIALILGKLNGDQLAGLKTMVVET